MTSPPATPRSPLRRLTGDTIVYGLGGSATRLVTVLFVPVFTRIFTPADYGVLDLLTTLLSLMSIFAMLGANSAIFYFYRSTTDDRERGRMVSTALALATLTALAIGVLGMLFVDPLSPLLAAEPRNRLALMLTFVWLPINIAASLTLDLLRLEFRRYAFTLLGVGRTLIGSALGVALVLMAHAGIAGLIGAQVVTAALAAVVGLWLSRRVWVPSFDPVIAGRIVRFGLPLVPTGLSYWALQYIDRYFVLGFRGATELGLYAIANRLAGLIQLLAYAFQTAWWPFAYAQAEDPGHRVLFARVFKIATIGLLCVTLLIGLFAREVLMTLTTPSYVPAYAYVGLLTLALVINSSYQVISIGVQLAGKTASMAWTSAVAAVVNIGLNFALIPTMGLWGASISTAAAYLTSTALLYRVAQRHHAIPYDVRGTAIVALGAGLVQGAGLFLDRMVPNGSWDPAITAAKVLLALAAGALLLAWLHLTPMSIVRAVRSLLEGPRRMES